MQDPNADTEWNDILRAKGILPAKEEPTVDEETVVKVREGDHVGRGKGDSGNRLLYSLSWWKTPYRSG